MTQHEHDEMEFALKCAKEIIKTINMNRMSRMSQDVNKEWEIEFVTMDPATMNTFSDWDQQRLALIPNDDYLVITDITRRKYNPHVLYVINVSGNSVMENMHQLFDLLASKF